MIKFTDLKFPLRRVIIDTMKYNIRITYVGREVGDESVSPLKYEIYGVSKQVLKIQENNSYSLFGSICIFKEQLPNINILSLEKVLYQGNRFNLKINYFNIAIDNIDFGFFLFLIKNEVYPSIGDFNYFLDRYFKSMLSSHEGRYNKIFGEFIDLGFELKRTYPHIQIYLDKYVIKPEIGDIFFTCVVGQMKLWTVIEIETNDYGIVTSYMATNSGDNTLFSLSCNGFWTFDEAKSCNLTWRLT